MDINSLLSPQDSSVPPMNISSVLSPRDSPAEGTASPGKRPLRQPMPSRTPSNLSQNITSSPHLPAESAHQIHTPNFPQSGYHPHVATSTPLQSPGVGNFQNGRAVHSATNTPPVDPRSSLGSVQDARMTPPHPAIHRQASTPGMDTLADLASMQQQQSAARQSAANIGGPQVRPSLSLQNIPRTISGGSASDIGMSDAPPPPRTFISRALDLESLNLLRQLAETLSENPFDYESRVLFVSTLHQGLQNHLFPADGSAQDGNTYELLPDLRQAYQDMDKIYPVGEQIWEYWINDEKALAQKTEDRLAVMELCNKAVQDEPFSSKLWSLYGEYVTSLVECTKDPPEQWSEEDRIMGREIFSLDLLIGVWERGAEATKDNIKDSHLVWDRYLQVLLEDLQQNPTSDKVRRISTIFDSRLNQPHSTWDNTFSMFSTFNSAYNQQNYDDVMQLTIQRTSNVKKLFGLREKFEFDLDVATQQGDRASEYHHLTRYLKWEKKTAGLFSFHLVNALFERAQLRFPTDATLWEDHVEFLIWKKDPSVSLLEVLERATRHCPWSGSLWSHRILTLEAENKDFNQIEAVKHSATESGMLEHGGLEELIKVQIAWCGYLRRKAFENSQASDDDIDICEVGIRSALEHVKEIGLKKYGNDYQGDPQYRLERIHIKFFSQQGDVNGARQIWRSLVPQQQDSYDFWYRYYIWEMVIWSNHAVRDKNVDGQNLKTPSLATEVLQEGMKRVITLDYPEQLIPMFVNHCEQHESVLKLRSALIEARRATLRMQIRRSKEAEAQAAANGYSGYAQPAVENQVDQTVATTKRKRDHTPEAPGSTLKKTKQDIHDAPPTVAESVEQPNRAASEAHSQPGKKRDREHASIIVKRLPVDVAEVKVQQFFTDCGTVKSIILKPEVDSVTATIEFEAPEDAQYALTKQAKGFEGSPIEIDLAGGTSLFVSNYPASADEAYIRKLFQPFGDIVEIRFPSLKYDTHRRFCYVQFASVQQAVEATQLDGTEVDGLTLTTKISDPTAKKKRDGATAEGREVYIWHLDYKATEQDLKSLFSKFGEIERIRLPKGSRGSNKGFGFVVFDNNESANAAVAEMDKKVFRTLELHVEIAKEKGESTKQKTKSVVRLDDPEIDKSPTTGIDGSSLAAPAPQPQFQRTVALLNIPDTVNDARVRAFVEPVGKLKKITLMPLHQGAIIEFVHAEDAGKAGLALEGKEIAEGRPVHVGSTQELKHMTDEKRVNDLTKKNKVTKQSLPFAPTAALNRASARSLRGVRRGGLGFKRGGGFPSRLVNSSEGDDGKEKKSNSDFRAMFVKAKDESKEASMDVTKDAGQSSV